MTGTPIQRPASRGASLLALLFLIGCGGGEFPTEPTPTPTPSEPTPSPERLLINELVSAPGRGELSDWIELYNPAETDVSLAGWSLRDGGDGIEDLDPDPLDESLVVPAGGHLRLLADGEPALGPTHLPLSLAVDGERLQLLHGDDVVDDVTFGELVPGWSLARNGDGSPDWKVRVVPTPGQPNPVGAPPNPVPAAPLRCGPVASVDRAEVVEGDEVLITMDCAEEPIAAFDIEVITAGPPGSWDGAAWSRTTDLADAGSLEVLFAVKPAGEGGVPETRRAAVWVVDDWTSPGNEPVDPQTYTHEFGLPVMHIAPSAPLSQSYGEATTWFEGEEYASTLKIRGASSADFPKNHFTMEFEPTQVDLGAYGLGRKDHLVLISTFDDNAYVRQKLVYDAWIEMAAFRGTTPLTPRTAFLVVYLDGVYHGLYIAIDHVDDEFMGELGYDPAANLYKSVSHDANFWLTRANGDPKGNLGAGWEKKEGPDEDWSDLLDLTQWAGSIDPATFAAEQEDWIEPSEFVDWLLLVHHFAANDSAGKNAYVYNAPAEQRFHYVPWDFNHALGQDWRTLRVSADTHTHFENRNAIFSHLVNEPGLAAQVWDHYDALRGPGAPLSAGRLLSLTDAYYELIHLSAERDWLRWGEEYASFGRWASQRQSDLLDYPGERAYMEQWILDREAAMSGLHPVGAP